MFRNALSLLAASAVVNAVPIDWSDPSLYKNVNWNDPSLYTNVDFSKINYDDLPFFVLQGGSAVTNERLDAVMAPGQAPSQHVHGFAGANVVGANTTFEDLQQATCSTFGVKADKSGYWNPILYGKTGDGQFIRVPEQPRRKIYYLYGGDNNSNDDTITPFPQDFKMITGDPTCTTADCAAPYQLTWTCYSNNNAAVTTGFPTGQISCPGGWMGGGLKADMFFPDCWNGQDFDAKNPHAHMAFHQGNGLQGCPATHQVARFPQMHAEIFFNVDGLAAAGAPDSPLVLAFGDTTGYGFHIDFMNGWDSAALGNAIKTCRLGDGSSPTTLTQCFGADGIYDQTTIDNCLLAPTIQENVGWDGTADKSDGSTVGGIVAALPGCQTLTKAGDTVSLKTCPVGGAVATREIEERGAVRVGDDGTAIVVDRGLEKRGAVRVNDDNIAIVVDRSIEARGAVRVNDDNIAIVVDRSLPELDTRGAVRVNDEGTAIVVDRSLEERGAVRVNDDNIAIVVDRSLEERGAVRVNDQNIAIVVDDK